MLTYFEFSNLIRQLNNLVITKLIIWLIKLLSFLIKLTFYLCKKTLQWFPHCNNWLSFKFNKTLSQTKIEYILQNYLILVKLYVILVYFTQYLKTIRSYTWNAEIGRLLSVVFRLDLFVYYLTQQHSTTVP